MENCIDDLPVLFWSEGLEIRGDSCDPFDPSLCGVAGIWSWLAVAILGVNGVRVVGVGGGLRTDFLQCGSIVGLISSLSDIVENCRIN